MVSGIYTKWGFHFKNNNPSLIVCIIFLKGSIFFYQDLNRIKKLTLLQVNLYYFKGIYCI